MLQYIAGDVRRENKTKSDSDFYEKYASLDVNKVAAKIGIPRMNCLILMTKLEPERQSNTAAILLKKITFQCY